MICQVVFTEIYMIHIKCFYILRHTFQISNFLQICRCKIQVVYQTCSLADTFFLPVLATAGYDSLQGLGA